MKELDLAIKTAKAAGKFIASRFEKPNKVRKKGDINLVTEVDEKTQRLIVSMIKKKFPKDQILAEEGDLSETQTADRLWIVDPLDGTTNFAYNYPRFCVSIAFQEKGVIKAGVIYDPMMKECFTAEKGKGARLNGRKLKVRSEKTLKDSLLVTGFPYDLYDPANDNLKLFSKLIFNAMAIRRDGSAALNLAYVAAGRFSAFWELGLSAWDVAAGILMIEEAGGICLPFRTKKHGGLPVALVAGPEVLARQLLEEIQKIEALPSHKTA